MEHTIREEQTFERIQQSHQLDGDSELLQQYYRTWADSYDIDVQAEQYIGPNIVSSMACSVYDAYHASPKTTCRVLDAGCGTGLTGLALRHKGFSDIEGFDLSPQMVELAARTGVYSFVKEKVDLNQALVDFESDNYDLTVCCGVFTLGHVKPECLKELMRVTKPGGIVILSTRKSYFETTNFSSVIENIVDQKEGTLVACYKNAQYIAEEGAHYWAVQVS